MPSSASVVAALTGLATLILAVAGVTDPQIQAGVQQVIPPAAAVVLLGLAWIHHKRSATQGAQSLQAATIAQAANAARAPQAPASPLPVHVSPTMLAQIGAAVEAARIGVLATGPATAPGPAIVGTVDRTPTTEIPTLGAIVPAAEEFPTQEIATLSPIPAPASPAATIGA